MGLCLVLLAYVLPKFLYFWSGKGKLFLFPNSLILVPLFLHNLCCYKNS